MTWAQHVKCRNETVRQLIDEYQTDLDCISKKDDGQLCMLWEDLHEKIWELERRREHKLSILKHFEKEVAETLESRGYTYGLYHDPCDDLPRQWQKPTPPLTPEQEAERDKAIAEYEAQRQKDIASGKITVIGN